MKENGQERQPVEATPGYPAELQHNPWRHKGHNDNRGAGVEEMTQDDRLYSPPFHDEGGTCTSCLKSGLSVYRLSGGLTCHIWGTQGERNEADVRAAENHL
eukprot:GHVU01171179.1.p2 GENE.GHVU01171179.1~~GHVU01171179.1.p2  ORF type:complete len:101 (+),score=15.00 GHVU01171179.1:42-344(+)